MLAFLSGESGLEVIMNNFLHSSVSHDEFLLVRKPALMKGAHLLTADVGNYLNSQSYLSKASAVNRNLVYCSKSVNNPLKHTGIFNEENCKDLSVEMKNTQNFEILSFYKIKAQNEVTPEPYSQSCLKFGSDFESGNLLRAYHHKENEFVLLLRPDYNNSKYVHWFYFSVKPNSAMEITFHIVNITKKDTALMQGMQIVAKRNKSWERAGKNIRFYENTRFLEYTQGSKAYALSFTYEFTDKKKIYFAYSYPYTYKNLKDYLCGITSKHSQICELSELCLSACNFPCPLLTVTDSIIKDPYGLNKKAIVLIGRVHPSESPSSYIMKGLIDYLLSPEADYLRKSFYFKIIPMINPDGVKFGNSRSSLFGTDLNRRWIDPHPKLHPEIFAAKRLIKRLKETHEVSMFCDFHSHAKKKNVFMYGCNSIKSDKITKERNSLAKLIPMVLAKSNSHFSLKDSHFKMNKSKEGTARIVMFKEFGIVNSYTIETSFFGSEYQKIFTVEDWENVGCDLAKTCSAVIGSNTVVSSMSPAAVWNTARKGVRKASFINLKKMRVGKAVESSLGCRIRKPIDVSEISNLPNLHKKKIRGIKSGKHKTPNKEIFVSRNDEFELNAMLSERLFGLNYLRIRENVSEMNTGREFISQTNRKNSVDTLEIKKLPNIK